MTAWVAAGNPKAAGWILIPDPPSPAHSWDGVQWVAPDPSEAAAANAATIRHERDRRILAGVKLGADWFHSGTQEQIQYMGMLMMGANLPTGTPLKTMDGRNVGATPQRVGALFQAIAAQQATLHAIADAAIAAGTAPDAVQWPPSFQG